MNTIFRDYKKCSFHDGQTVTHSSLEMMIAINQTNAWPTLVMNDWRVLKSILEK